MILQPGAPKMVWTTPPPPPPVEDCRVTTLCRNIKVSRPLILPTIALRALPSLLLEPKKQKWTFPITNWPIDKRSGEEQMKKSARSRRFYYSGPETVTSLLQSQRQTKLLLKESGEDPPLPTPPPPRVFPSSPVLCDRKRKAPSSIISVVFFNAARPK